MKLQIDAMQETIEDHENKITELNAELDVNVCER